MVTDADLRRIFSSAPVNRDVIEVISLSAPWFTQTYYMQNQIVDDVEITLETGQVVTARYVPMSRGQASSNADLTYERNIVIQYCNDIIASEIARFTQGAEKPILTSRGYVLYRDGTVSTIKTPAISVIVRNLEINEQGASITASTKPANVSGTGERNTITRIPMQRGFS